MDHSESHAESHFPYPGLVVFLRMYAAVLCRVGVDTRRYCHRPLCVGILRRTFPLAYNGLGDVCVVLFYGIIPVCFTYYVQALSFSLLSFLLSVSVGLLSTNILVVNNYRDYVQDKASHKRTTIVLFGRSFGRIFYLLNGVMALLLAMPLMLDAPWWIQFLFAAFFALFYATWRQLYRFEGRELNKTLGHTARNVFLFTLLLSLLLISLTTGL